MACSSSDRPDAGYATASAIAVSLALGLIATALTGLASAELKTARGDFGRMQTEYALDAAHAAAALALFKTEKAQRLRWTLTTRDGTFDVLAEPEASKTGYSIAAKLDDADLHRLDVGDPDPLRLRLKAELDAPASRARVQDLDASPTWRACAPSVISRYGGGGKLALSKAKQPDERRFSWRSGEVWRVMIASRAGWTDERIVRFTGDPLHPAAVVDRRFSREGSTDGKCETLFASP